MKWFALVELALIVGHPVGMKNKARDKGEILDDQTSERFVPTKRGKSGVTPPQNEV